MVEKQIIGHFPFLIFHLVTLVAPPNNSGVLMLGQQASSPAGFLHAPQSKPAGEDTCGPSISTLESFGEPTKGHL